MASGSWGAAMLWARADVRARWRSVVALGLIAGVTAGFALAAAAGAVRTGTALDRLEERTNSSDAIVFASQVGVLHPDWTKLAGRPEVRSLARWALVSGQLGDDPEGILFTAVDDATMQATDAPVVIEGRRWNPDADDEVMVADGFAAHEHVHVGDTFPFIPFTPEENDEARNRPGEADAVLQGPHLTMHVVGIVRTPLEPLFVTDGFVMAPPGLIRHHADISFHENAFVQLANPGRDARALARDVNSDVAVGAPVLDLHKVRRRVTASTDVEQTALALLAGVIALAGLVLAGQLVTRSASTITADARVLEAVGMRRTTVAGAAALSHVPAAVVTSAAAIATAVVTSRWLPLGQAARVEPNPGMRLDAWIVLPGTAAIALLLLAATFLTAARAAARGPGGAGGEPRGVAEWVRRHASAPVGIGVTLALRKGRGRDGLPVLPALFGAAIGILGVAGALTLDAGLRDSLAHPERAGVAWEAQAEPGDVSAYTTDGLVPGFVDPIRHSDAITDRVQVDRAGIAVNSATGLPTYSLRPVDGDRSTRISLVTLDGRGPRHSGEAAIGPATAKALGVHVGDTIAVGQRRLPVRLVGTALFPTDVHAEFDEGLWLDPADFDAASTTDTSTERFIAVRFAPGAAKQGYAALQTAVEPFHGGAGSAEVPPELTNLRGVRPLPRLLAALLGVLALAALLHVLASTARVRAGDFAVLRAIGFTRRSARAVIGVQGASVSVVGLAFGIPLGIAAGRVGWTEIAQRVPLEEVSPLALVATVLLVPAALLVTQLVAIGPARRVARLRTAEVLRSE